MNDSHAGFPRCARCERPLVENEVHTEIICAQECIARLGQRIDSLASFVHELAGVLVNAGIIEEFRP